MKLTWSVKLLCWFKNLRGHVRMDLHRLWNEYHFVLMDVVMQNPQHGVRPRIEHFDCDQRGRPKLTEPGLINKIHQNILETNDQIRGFHQVMDAFNKNNDIECMQDSKHDGIKIFKSFAIAEMAKKYFNDKNKIESDLKVVNFFIILCFFMSLMCYCVCVCVNIMLVTEEK